MPLADGMSMLSTPLPARPMMRSLGAAARRSFVTFVALRTMRASASGRHSFAEIFRLATGARVDLPAFAAEDVERRFRQVVGNYDFHF
ncbi:MAG: hypothetical protein QM736_13730 [Vicinamibacterales bacterium]